MNKQFVKWMSIFSALTLDIAQNLPYDTPAFKAIEKKLKINKRQVYWDFYTTQVVQGDSLNQLIVFFHLLKGTRCYEIRFVCDKLPHS